MSTNEGRNFGQRPEDFFSSEPRILVPVCFLALLESLGFAATAKTDAAVPGDLAFGTIVTDWALSWRRCGQGRQGQARAGRIEAICKSILAHPQRRAQSEHTDHHEDNAWHAPRRPGK